jgi:hypothetical protein
MNAHMVTYCEWLAARLPDLLGCHVRMLGWDRVRDMANIVDMHWRGELRGQPHDSNGKNPA